MNSRRIGVVILAIFTIGIAALGLARYAYMKRLEQEATAWKTRIALAATPGTSENRIVRVLGRPGETLESSEMNKYARPRLLPPAGTTRALLYYFTPSVFNTWTAYIFFSEERKVLGYEIRST